MLFFFKGDEPGEFWRLLGGRTSTPITVSIHDKFNGHKITKMELRTMNTASVVRISISSRKDKPIISIEN